MRRLRGGWAAGIALVGGMLLALLLLAGCGTLPEKAQTAVPPILTGIAPGAEALPGVLPDMLPGRQTPSPAAVDASAPATNNSVCLAIYPLDQIEAVDFDATTLAQLEAAFGAADLASGRPTRLRFERQGCVLLATAGMMTPTDLELLDYGTLALLTGRYGLPEAAGIAEGNLALPTAGVGVLFYPVRGIIAIFDAPLESLTLESPLRRLIFIPPYTLADQTTRLNVRITPWQPPT